MSEIPSRSPSSDDLQFTTAEAVSSAQPAGHGCAACGQPTGSTYYALGDQVICATCRERLTAPPTGSGFMRFGKASLFGIGAGLVGALIWFAIRRFAHLEIGYVAILVGFMVGKSVFIGSGNQGGRGYQALAVLITYCCIAINYMPDVVEALLDREPVQPAAAGEVAKLPQAENAERPAADDAAAQPNVQPAAEEPVSVGRAIVALAILSVLVFAISLAAPFLAGTQNLIGLLIIAFALWEAWKFNARRQLPISGPFEMGPSPTA